MKISIESRPGNEWSESIRSFARNNLTLRAEGDKSGNMQSRFIYPSSMILTLAKRENEFVGAAISEKSRYLPEFWHQLYVPIPYRKMGIGIKLLNSAMEYCHDSSIAECVHRVCSWDLRSHLFFKRVAEQNKLLTYKTIHNYESHSS